MSWKRGGMCCPYFYDAGCDSALDTVLCDFYLTNFSVVLPSKRMTGSWSKIACCCIFSLSACARVILTCLTYPAASLGVPLVCILACSGQTGFVTKVKNVVCLSVSWGFGYGADVGWQVDFEHAGFRDNVMANALSQILLRASHTQNGERLTVLDTWLRNVEFYFEKPYLILIALCLAAVLQGYSEAESACGCIDSIPFCWLP